MAGHGGGRCSGIASSRHRIPVSSRHRVTNVIVSVCERSHRICNEARCVPPYAAWGQNNSEQHCHRERMRTISPNTQCNLPRYTAHDCGAGASHCQHKCQRRTSQSTTSRSFPAPPRPSFPSPGCLPHPRLVQTGRVRMTWRGMVEGAALALRHRIAASPPRVIASPSDLPHPRLVRTGRGRMTWVRGGVRCPDTASSCHRVRTVIQSSGCALVLAFQA
jgi:hypothetical protein